MAGTFWTQQAVERFFEGRKHPPQAQCDQIARSVSGAQDVSNVDTPGSMSYTVVCTGCQPGNRTLIVSFREPEAGLDDGMVKAAQTVHGSLVPGVSRHGTVDGSEPPLAVHVMPCLPGISCLDALACEVEMDEATETGHFCFVRHLARYFGRCWSKPQPVTDETRARHLEGIRRRLALLGSSSPLDASVVSELEDSLPALFAQDYPQVLTHGDLSLTNILVDEDSYEITGIVDWALAAVLPFGLELDSLLLTTGYMDLSGWHDYGCRARLHEAFWDEFWSAAGVEDDGRRASIRHTAESAARIGAVLRYAFKRNADGSPSETLIAKGASGWTYLQTWLA